MIGYFGREVSFSLAFSNSSPISLCVFTVKRGVLQHNTEHNADSTCGGWCEVIDATVHSEQIECRRSGEKKEHSTRQRVYYVSEFIHGGV